MTNSTINQSLPLTTEQLAAGGWWCEDFSYATVQALRNGAGLEILPEPVTGSYSNNHCYLDHNGKVRLYQGVPFGIPYTGADGFKQIRRVGNDFYWSE